jgi:hypothetical protein
MQRRLPLGFWLPMGTLLSVALWYGCEQKGDLSPVSSARDNLAFVDSVVIDPPVIVPLGTATIEAYVVNEQHEPAPGENVRFTVTRGSFDDVGPDVTVETDNYGVARTTYTAPEDTGNVSLHVELVSMQTAQTRTFGVRNTGMSNDGLISVVADEDTLFADNGASTTQIRARVRNELNNPIGGVEVTFSTTRGVITSPAITDAQSGTALATLTSTNAIGSAMVIARYNDNADTVMVNFLEPFAASSIQVNTSLSSMTAGMDTSVISARVLDEQGQTLHSKRPGDVYGQLWCVFSFGRDNGERHCDDAIPRSGDCGKCDDYCVDRRGHGQHLDCREPRRTCIIDRDDGSRLTLGG